MLTAEPSLIASGVARRSLLAGIGSLVALPAIASPPGIRAEAWVAYEARLRARLVDAGGGRFDPLAERRLLDLTNAARVSNGAGACGWSEELALTARAHAADLADRNYIEHLAP
ncbi:MAG: CAP domain-containing protein, partial [Caulobacteraceae bacterium]